MAKLAPWDRAELAMLTLTPAQWRDHVARVTGGESGDSEIDDWLAGLDAVEDSDV